MNICDFDGLTGRVITSDDPYYEELRQVYNRAVNKFPLAIVYCQKETDVSNAVLWSRSHHVSLRIRNGGHNYEGYSTGNDILAIDLSEMNQISIDETANLLTVQGGAKNRQVYEFVSSMGYPFPGGTCPSVGVSGYALGGGWGLSCRYLGLGCDCLTQLRMINYEGTALTASPTENPDLFWALRGGGGGNFGIIVSMTFRLPGKVDKITLIDIRYPDSDQEKQSAFVQVWQDWLTDTDPRITLVSRIFNSREDGLGILARGFFYGPPEAALGIIQPLLRLGGVKYTLKYLPFLEAVNIIGSFYPPYEAFQSTSRFVLRDLTDCESCRLAAMIADRPQGSSYAALSFYALGGKVSQVDPDATAFYYRNAKYILWLNTVFDGCKCDNSAWIADRFCYLQTITEGAYVNFPYDALPRCQEEYYGSNACRLKMVKERYDPLNIFSFPQGIGSKICC